jgi:hypothetical protein
MRAYIAHLVGGAPAGAGGSESPSSGGGPSTQSTPQPKPFHPRRRNRTHEEEVRALGWPTNEEGRISARGLLYATNGTRLAERVWKADPTAEHGDLREPWASASDHVARWHVEGQVCAWMRQTRTREAVLYQNLPACGRQSGDPGRCDRSIAPMLPEGYTLVVWTVPKQGNPYSVRYRGTGEAIR